MTTTSVLFINLDQSHAHFVDFCKQGAVDLVAMDPPIYMLSHVTEHWTNRIDSLPKTILGNWPRPFRSVRSLFDVANEILLYELNRQRQVTVVTLSHSIQNLAENNISGELLRNVTAQQRALVVSVAAVTSSPQGTLSDIAQQNEQDLNFDTVFSLGDGFDRNYDLQPDTHYNGLRFVLDAARDSGEARQWLTKTTGKQTSMYWISPAAPIEPTHATEAGAFLRHQLAAYLEPQDANQKMDIFRDEIDRQKEFIREINQATAPHTPLQIHTDLSMKRMPFTRNAAIEYLNEYEKEVTSQIQDIVEKKLPLAVSESTESANRSFKIRHEQLQNNPPIVPRATQDSGIPMKVEELATEIKGLEITLAESARESRITSAHERLTDLQNEFSNSIQEARENAESFPRSNLSTFAGLFLGLSIAALWLMKYLHSLVFSQKSIPSIIDGYQAILFEIGQLPLNMSIFLLAVFLFNAVNLWLHQKNIWRHNNKLAAYTAKMTEPLEELTNAIATYRRHSRASQYAREVSSFIEKRRKHTAVYDDIYRQIRDFPSASQYNSIKGRDDILTTILERIESDAALAETVIINWRDKLDQSSLWNVDFNYQSVDSSIPITSESAQSGIVLPNSFLRQTTAVELSPMEWPQSSRSTPG
jgi:hypothetical protein